MLVSILDLSEKHVFQFYNTDNLFQNLRAANMSDDKTARVGLYIHINITTQLLLS